MTKKWDYKTTSEFIKLYKLHPCLWDYKSPDFKNKYRREQAYVSIVRDLNMPDFGIQEAKNKIKNLRSTYNQEVKKIQDSIKAGAGLTNVYTPSIKWLSQMDEVIMNLKKQPSENANETAHEETDNHEIVGDLNFYKPRRQKRKSTAAINISYAKPNQSFDLDISSGSAVNETAFDMFGRSVAMQLKVLSVENALLAQCKIQSILTEFGITDHRQKTSSRSSLSNHSNQRTSPEFLDDTDASSINEVSIEEHVTSPITVHQVKRRRRLDD